MPTFQYIAKDKDGHNAMGLLEAANENEAAELLHKKELFVVSLGAARKKVTKAKLPSTTELLKASQRVG